LNKISRSEEVTEAEFTQSGLALLSQTYESWEVASQALGHLIDHRVDTLSSHRYKSLGMAGLALLSAILFSIVVGASVSQSIRGITVYRVISYIPVIISIVVAGIAFKWL
jgi:ABC-type Fe3+ transport system permease subunit